MYCDCQLVTERKKEARNLLVLAFQAQYLKIYSVTFLNSYGKFTTMVGKFTSKSPALQLILKKFLSRGITRKGAPKKVWEGDEIFQQHSL